MGGSGIKEIIRTIYGENAVQYIMSGNTVQRTFHGDLLIDQCLIQEVTNKVAHGPYKAHPLLDLKI